MLDPNARRRRAALADELPNLTGLFLDLKTHLPLVYSVGYLGRLRWRNHRAQPKSGFAGCRARFLIRDRDGKFPALFDAGLKDAGIDVVLSGVRMPRMNSIMER